jgi:spermidine/putrescine transport system substrate-binding protein
MKYCILCILLCSKILYAANAVAEEKILNLYAWGNVIPMTLIHKFEKLNNIQVNYTTYDNNETMYIKILANRNNPYDVIMPSSYYVEKMQNKGMLTKLDDKQIPNLKYLSTEFINDLSAYNVPLIWGSTGMFYNALHKNMKLKSWQDLWQKYWKASLLILNDPRDVFSMSLLSLGYEPNDKDPKHIKQAYEKLLSLMPNVKIFASEGLKSMIIDEDVMAGMMWSGDITKAIDENKDIKFIYPKEGFVIWSDGLSIPINPPHPEAAHKFINFMLEPENAAFLAQISGYAITNQAGKNLLPKELKDNQINYPSKEILKRGYIQRNIDEKVLKLYNKYWGDLKLSIK